MPVGGEVGNTHPVLLATGNKDPQIPKQGRCDFILQVARVCQKRILIILILINTN